MDGNTNTNETQAAENQEVQKDTGTQTGSDKPEASSAIDYEKLASIVDGRTKATEETVIKNYLKQQGLSADEMTQAISTFKEKKAAAQPDVAGMQAQIAALTDQVNKSMISNAAMQTCANLGIDAKAIPYVIRMADFKDAIKDGAVNTEAVSNAINQVLTDIPALKPASKEQTGFKVGGIPDNTQAQTSAETEQEMLKDIFLGKKK